MVKDHKHFLLYLHIPAQYTDDLFHENKTPDRKMTVLKYPVISKTKLNTKHKVQSLTMAMINKNTT